MAKRRNPEKKMKLSGHLRELRKRLFRSAYAILAGTIFGWTIFDQVFHALQEPVIQLSKESGVRATINFGSVVSAFDLQVQISFFIGIFITSPFWLYQIWAFVAPALQKKEKRYTVAFILTSTPFFLGGAYFGWWMFPGFVKSLLSFTPADASNVINAAEYVLFTVRVVFVFGLAFVLPVILVLLNGVGIMTGKTILKGWRLALFIIAIIGALATPVSDPVSMLLLMIPLIILYFIAAGIAIANDKRKAMRSKNSLEGMSIADDYTPDEVD
jgi:sec-independent protein translocase protein TatC